MALFAYTVVDKQGKEIQGTIEALNQQLAVQSLQGRGYLVASVRKKTSRGAGLQMRIRLSNKPPMRQLVVMTRQLATLFESQISALKVFTLMADSAENDILKEALTGVAQDIKAGTSVTQAMQKFPNVFSNFYIGMVRAGSESGTLSDAFLYLADYLERQYELTNKTRNALIYPSFVVATFIGVMILMLTVVIPRLGTIITESGQDVPVYTRFVLGLSNFFVSYGWVLLILLVGGIVALFSYLRNPSGRETMDRLKLKIPVFGQMFSKLYLARIADNLNTMLSAGIPVLRALEITADVVGNLRYQEIIQKSMADVKGGQPISTALDRHEEVPSIMVQMMRVGEETGSLGKILQTLARFYKREVDTAVDALIGLIEPALIILLAIGVGFLLTAVLMPIYNLSSAF